MLVYGICGGGDRPGARLIVILLQHRHEYHMNPAMCALYRGLCVCVCVCISVRACVRAYTCPCVCVFASYIQGSSVFVHRVIQTQTTIKR